jgi:hypothetical protein
MEENEAAMPRTKFDSGLAEEIGCGPVDRTKDILNPHLEGSWDCSSRSWLAQRRWPRRIRLNKGRLLKRTVRTNAKED